MNIRLIARITEKDNIFGKLCSEAQNSYEQENYFSALACLFISTEQAVKFIVESQFIKFEEEALKEGEKYWALWKYIKFARKNNLITEDEKQIINSLMEYRNSIFHANLYPAGVEIEGKFWSFSEDSTLQIIYKSFSPKIFQLIFKLIT